MLGKYLNHYGEDDPIHVPPGWDEWHAKVDTSATEEDTGTEGDAVERYTKYYDYELNENGGVVSYGDSAEDYLTDVLSGKATDFVRRAASHPEPFFSCTWLRRRRTAPPPPPSATRARLPMRRPPLRILR